MTAAAVRLLAVRSGERCPYCHDALAGRTAACLECGAQLHRSCWSSLRGACPTLGCDGTAPREPAPRPALLAAGALVWTGCALAIHALDLAGSLRAIELALMLFTAPAWVVLVVASLLHLARRPLSLLGWACLCALLLAPTAVRALGPSLAARAVLAWHRDDWERLSDAARAAAEPGGGPSASTPGGHLVVVEDGLVWIRLEEGLLAERRRAFVHAPSVAVAEVATGRFFVPWATTWEPLGDGWWLVDQAD